MSDLVVLPSPDPKRQRLYRHGDRKYSIVILPDMYGFYAPHVWELAELTPDGGVDVLGRFETDFQAVEAIKSHRRSNQPKEVM